jgi:predicted negative regulator of RcsB-dependent stress response
MVRLEEGERGYSIMGRLALGDILVKKGDPDAAIREFQTVIEGQSRFAESSRCMGYLHLGDALKQRGDIGAARQAWKEAVRWDDTGIIAKEARQRLKPRA